MSKLIGRGCRLHVQEPAALPMTGRRLIDLAREVNATADDMIRAIHRLNARSAILKWEIPPYLVREVARGPWWRRLLSTLRRPWRRRVSPDRWICS